MPSDISVQRSPTRQEGIATPASRHGRVLSPFTPLLTPFTPFTPFTPIFDWLPLPPKTCPRTLERPARNAKFYATLAAVVCIWSVTLCHASVWRMRGAVRIVACVFAAYALVETVFAIYYYHLIRRAKIQPPPTGLPPVDRNAFFHKVLSLDAFVSATIPQPRTSSVPSGGKPRQRKTALSELQIKIDNARIKDRTLPSMDEVVMTATGDKMMDPSGAIGEIAVWEESANTIFKDDNHAIELRERLRPWFDHAPWETIRKENVLMWLSWICLDLPLHQARESEQHLKCLQETLEKLELEIGMIIPNGFDPKPKVHRPSLDPVIIKTRPIVLYGAINVVSLWLKYVTYPGKGWKLHQDGGIQYLIRIPPGWTAMGDKKHAVKLPVVYIQGLGFGLIHSMALVKRLMESLPDHPLMLPLQPHTSQALFHSRHLRPWSRTEFVESMKRVCTEFGFWHEGHSVGSEEKTESWGGVSILSHSNGSVAHSWIINECPSLAKRNTFVDPIVFCTWEGDLAWSCFYRRPATAQELLLFYLVASEVGIAHCIRRHFDWTNNTLLFEDIPNGLDPKRTAFFLERKDMVIDAKRIRTYMERRMCKVEKGAYNVDGVTAGSLQWDETGTHGQALRGDSLRRVVNYAGTGSTRRRQSAVSSAGTQS